MHITQLCNSSQECMKQWIWRPKYKQPLLSADAVSFLDLEGGSQKATLVVVVLVGISSLKVPEAFLMHSITKLCIHTCADIAYRSTVSDFSLIFYLMSNYS